MSLLNKTLATLFCGLLLTACAHSPEKKSQASSLATQQVLEATSRLDNTFYQYKQLSKKKPVIALVLGSGGARGYAHIGVIEVLEQHGIKPDFIVGTSAGSIVGSIYASGKSPEQLRQIALNMKVGDVRDFKIGMKGFFDGQKVEDYVNKQIDQMPLEKMKIPMYVVATELQNGEKTIFNYGNTGQAVRASVSIPSMFIPTKIKGKEYVDGGLVSPVPVNIAKELGADIVIAVDILAQPVNTETTNVWGLFNQNINIMQNRLAAEELKNADIVIQPDLREKAHIFDVKGRQDTMQAGIDAANQRMHDLDVVIASKKSLETAQQQYQVQN
ncbi:patatin-like phospholipase family protein [Acinetobacter sp. I-MWF]|uniref:patatin-like phospholipase family protein n=1 Tax=Acinetobacter TaxID=469 RepID=UPI0021C8774B|nr:patatin-like phospholipase family protein [Acinetobacter sp. I-MWF]